MSEISEMDWAQHIKLDYAQNLRKDQTKAKQTTFRRFIHIINYPTCDPGGHLQNQHIHSFAT